MVDLILIHPPINLTSWELKLGSKLPPMGLASLASYVREKGVSVKILDALNLGLSIDSVLDYVRQNSPSYVGITATTNMIFPSEMLAGKIKELFPEIITIIGGAHISALPEETIERFSSFDVGIVGEGEKTLYEIISSGKIDSSITGIVFKKDGTVIKTAARKYIEDLDEIPFPAYDLMDGFPDFYRPTPNNYSSLPVAPVISSRGCPYSCTFCDRGVFGSKLRAWSIDYLISLLKHLQDRYKINEVCFYDDIFILNKKKLYEFIDKKSTNNLNITWSCEGRVDQLDEQTLKDMRKAGCWQINYGIESGSQPVLDGLHKNIKVKQIRDTLIATKKVKMSARAYLIIGSPPETLQTLEENRELILSVPLTDIHISYFTPLPGSEVYKEVMNTNRMEDLKDINQYRINYLPPGISKEVLINYMNSLYRRFYFHPRRLLRYFFMLFNRHKTAHLVKSLFVFMKLLFAKDASKK